MITVHATALIYDGRGLFIRGDTGSGKSRLALMLLFDAPTRGLEARLIADDRVALAERNGRLIASVPPAIAGLIEVRGYGIVDCAYSEAGQIDWVVDLLPPDRLERYPQTRALSTSLLDCRLNRLPLPNDPATAMPVLMAALGIMPIKSGGRRVE